MSTRGTAVIDGKKFYIRSDAYPSFAKPVIKKALQSLEDYYAGYDRTLRFIFKANCAADFEWISTEELKGKFDLIFDEYHWIVNTTRGTFRQDMVHQRKFDKEVRKVTKEMKEKGWTGFVGKK